MSATFWGVLIIFVASFSVLAILLIGLFRQLKDLAQSIKRVQERIAPLADRLAAEGAAAQRSMDDLTSAAQSIGNRGRATSNGSRAAGVAADRPRPDPFAR